MVRVLGQNWLDPDSIVRHEINPEVPLQDSRADLEPACRRPTSVEVESQEIENGTGIVSEASSSFNVVVYVDLLWLQHAAAAHKETVPASDRRFSIKQFLQVETVTSLHAQAKESLSKSTQVRENATQESVGSAITSATVKARKASKMIPYLNAQAKKEVVQRKRFLEQALIRIPSRLLPIPD